MVGVSNDTNLLPLRAMARAARVPATWLRAEAEADRIPHLKAGARMLFHAPTVERILLERASRAATRGPAERAEQEHAP